MATYGSVLTASQYGAMKCRAVADRAQADSESQQKGGNGHFVSGNSGTKFHQGAMRSMTCVDV